MRQPLRFAFALLIVGLATVLGGRAADFDWPGHGTITFDVPATWSLSGKAVEVGYAVQARPKSGAAAALQMTFFDLPPGQSNASVDLKSQLKEVLQDRIASSVEKKFSPQPLKLARGTGWYTELTDASLVGKPPVPNNYKVMRSATLAADERCLAVATMRFDDPKSAEPAEMLALVSSLRFARKTAPAVTKVPSVDGYYRFTIPESRMLLQIPACDLVEDHLRLGATANNPRYFKFAGTSPNLNFSGWFEPAERYGGLKSFWADETEGMKKSGQPKAQNVTFLKVGAWDVIAYEMDLRVPGMTNVHVRAEAVQAGTWIDLHLSTTTDQSAAAGRDQLLATVRALTLVEKP